MTRTTVRFDTGWSVFAASAELAVTAEHRGDPAADDEAGDGCADDGGALVSGQLRPPIGQLLDLRLEDVDRVRELGARLLDRSADLGGAARALRIGHRFCSIRSPRMSLASSIAMSGVGGAPFLIQRSPMKPAIAANMKRKPNTMMKPIHGLVLTVSKRSLKNHATASNR